MDNPLLLLMRVLHVGLGVFWAGALFFVAIFLFPSLRDAGPDGAKVGAGLAKRRLTDVVPAAALVTVITGFWLYWTVSGGFAPEFMGSVPGMAYGVGGVTGLIALIVGLAVVRPSMIAAGRVAEAAAGMDDTERGQALSEAGRLRARAASASVIVAWLLGVTVITMAVGRYM